MPEIDGFQFTTLIRSIEKYYFESISKQGDPRISKAIECPVIAITAFESKYVSAEAQKVGIEKIL